MKRQSVSSKLLLNTVILCLRNKKASFFLAKKNGSKIKKKNGPELQKDPIIWARHTVTRRCMNIYLQHLHKSVADPRLASSFILLAVQPTFRCTVCPIPNPDHTTEYTGSTWGGCCCRAGGGTGEVGNTWGPGSSTGWAHHLPIIVVVLVPDCDL